MSNFHELDSRDYNYTDAPVYNYRSFESKIVDASDRIEKDHRLQERREKTARLFKLIIVFLLFVIVVQVIYHLYFAQNMHINRVFIKSDANFKASDSQILEMAGIGPSESFFSFDEGQVKLRLERYPQIASAEVEKKFPDALHISLKGRDPLVICLVEVDGRAVPAAVDSEGVIFQIGKSVSELNLPVLSGVRINKARLGSVMPLPVTGFLAGLEDLRRDSPVFFNSISEFRIERKSSEGFDVLMYPQNYSIPVRVGNTIDKELFTYVMLVLDVAEKQGITDNLEELDFRTDEVVYRIRGE